MSDTQHFRKHMNVKGGGKLSKVYKLERQGLQFYGYFFFETSKQITDAVQHFRETFNNIVPLYHPQGEEQPYLLVLARREWEQKAMHCVFESREEALEWLRRENHPEWLHKHLATKPFPDRRELVGTKYTWDHRDLDRGQWLIPDPKRPVDRELEVFSEMIENTDWVAPEEEETALCKSCQDICDGETEGTFCRPCKLLVMRRLK